MNKCFTKIVEFMLKSNDKYFESNSNYNRLLFYTVWNRPELNIKYVDFGYKYHFVGHTPSESVEYIEILNSNSNQLKNIIVLSDLNTFNNEHYDNCMWYSLKHFRSTECRISDFRSKELRDNIPISNTQFPEISEESDSFDYNNSDFDSSKENEVQPGCLTLHTSRNCNSTFHEMFLNSNDKLQFENFTLKILSNEIKYPDNLLTQIDIDNVEAAIDIYNDILV